MRSFKKLLCATAVIGLIASPVFAQTATTTPVPGHPRENEINQRLTNQENRTNAGVAQGNIGTPGAVNDSNRDAAISREESRDEAKNGGTLTKAEQAKMNRQLNRNSADIHQQRATPGTAASPGVPTPGQ